MKLYTTDDDLRTAHLIAHKGRARNIELPRVLVKHMGAYYVFPATGGYGRSGVPDIIGCYKGKFFGIECKAGKNKPTALQEKNLTDISSAEGISVVVNEDNMHEVTKILQC